MPQAIPAAAGAFASWVSGVVYAGATGIGLSTATAATVSMYAASLAIAGVTYGAQALVAVGLGALAQAQVPDVETGKISRKQTRPIRTYAVGGDSRMAGAYMLRESKGNKFGGVLACCEGRLGSVSQIYLNDDKVTLSGGFVQGMAGERYGSGDLVRLDYRLGEPTETHYSFLTADFGSYWPTTSRGDGVASIGWLAQHRSVESFPRHFPNGEIMPSMAAAPVCYDWRQDSTAGGSGDQRRDNPATWQVSWNPVVWLVHVEWARHGRSWARCIAPVLADLTDEADYCDETVEGEARYRVAGNYPANLMPDAVRGNILATMDGWMSVNGKGQLVVKAGRYVAPTFTLTADHIVGYSWRAFQVAEEAVSDLVVSYVSAAHDYSEIEAGTYSKAEPSPVGKSETLQLPWVPSPKQAIRLARRKMSRLDAQRRGSVRSTIYGLNGLGQRYIRVQNPELASMADVVLEVMNVEIDFARAEVVFDVILADTEIDEDEDVGTVAPPGPDHPPAEPGFEDPAEPTVGRDVIFPIEASANTIDIGAFNAVRRDGRVTALPADTLTGLADSTVWGVFWREDAGYEVEAFPATTHMTTGSWLFLGWQATPDGSGNYPANPSAPGGWGGDGPINDDLLRYPGGGTAGDLAVLDTVGAAQIDNGAVEASKLADNAVDLAGAKVTGKSLANIDSAAATKLAGIEAGAEVNPADLAALDSAAATKLAGIEAGATQNTGALADLNTVGAAQIDSSAVGTAKIATQAVTKPARYDSAAVTSLVSSGAMTGRTTVFSVTYTATGSEIEVDASFYLKAKHSQDDFVLYVVVETAGGDKFLATMPCQAISGDGHFSGWQTISFTDTPPAGSISYLVRVYHTFTIGGPGAFDQWDHSNRTMKIREFKR